MKNSALPKRRNPKMTSEYNEQRVLKIIEFGDCSRSYISGSLKISPEIVSAAISGLKDRGYDIVQYRGIYRLQKP